MSFQEASSPQKIKAILLKNARSFLRQRCDTLFVIPTPFVIPVKTGIGGNLGSDLIIDIH